MKESRELQKERCPKEERLETSFGVIIRRVSLLTHSRAKTLPTSPGGSGTTQVGSGRGGLKEEETHHTKEGNGMDAVSGGHPVTPCAQALEMALWSWLEPLVGCVKRIFPCVDVNVY